LRIKEQKKRLTLNEHDDDDDDDDDRFLCTSSARILRNFTEFVARIFCPLFRVQVTN
jgi:hypothetical protein